MKAEDLEEIQEEVASSGLEYAMIEESNWHFIEDDEFHRLRAEYIAAIKNLSDYLKLP